MTDYAIVCVDKQSSHGHILDVGIGNATFTVAQIYGLIDQGDKFHTGSVSAGNYARVEKFDCTYCGRPTLRSHADGYWNNNLDNLTSCRVA